MRTLAATRTSWQFAHVELSRIVPVVAVVGLALFAATRANAQDEPPPKIGPYALDLHLVVPKFPDDGQLAASRGLSQAELPGAGLGVSAGFHFYLPKIAGITVGVGGEAVIGRSSASPDTGATTSTTTGTTGTTTVTTLRPVTGVFKEISPQLSLNFGNGNGWSYLSVGIGRSVWSVLPDGGSPLPIDDHPGRTINYGGGARWFAKKRLAFSLDVRLYEIDAGDPSLALSGSPRTLLLVIGAGISVR